MLWRDFRFTYPINLSAVIWVSLPLPVPVFLTISSRKIRKFHSALPPAGVSSAFQVLRAIVPSDPAVAITACAVYSRSRKASEVIDGRIEVDRNCNSMIRRAFIVCKHSFAREHVAIFPFQYHQWV